MRKTNDHYRKVLERRMRDAERQVAEAARQHPAGRRIIHTAAHAPGLSTVAGRIERRIRRSELTRQAIAVGAGALAIGAAALALRALADDLKAERWVSWE